MDPGIFQETKLTRCVYTHRSGGYSIVATDAPSQHRGRVEVFYRPSPRYAVEAVQHFGPKVFGFKMETGKRRWYIVGCYLAPDDTSTIESIVAALKDQPRGAEMLVAGDLNVNLSEPEGDRRGEEISAELTTEGL